MSTTWDSWQRSLPKSPHADATQIRGNLSDTDKQIIANVFAYFTTGSGISRFPPFNNEVARGFKIVELNLWDNSSSETAESEMLLEIEITEKMCNVYGTMHGGCAAYLLDPTTAIAMVMLGRAKGFDGTGVSTSMNIYWHNAAPLGSTVTIMARSVFF
ncbi:hypothetical protein B0H19DRAFT_1148399, partial [Mycena capillaripes]